MSLTMSKLRAVGAIPSDRRGFIEINRARLETVACDCYALMQGRIDRMYCEELSAPQPALVSFRESSIVTFDEAGTKSRAVSREGK